MYKKITFIYDKSINLKSIKFFLGKIKNVEFIRLKHFHQKNLVIDKDNIILYQTFPDNLYYKNGNIKKPIKYSKIKKYKCTTHPKFDKKRIESSDFKFLNLPNQIKILVDCHDEPNNDGFYRFINEDYPFENQDTKKLINKLGKKYFYNFPRIKHCPSYDFKEKYNIVFDLHCYIEKVELNLDNFYNRSKIIHYSCSNINNKVRPIIEKKLEEYKNQVYLNLKPLNNYIESLKNIYAEINAPGWGRQCRRNLETLNTGCLLFIFDNFKDFDIIPNTKLIENEDYITFNLNNLDEKIEFVLNNDEIINKIRYNGHKKFMENYDFNKTTKEFKNFIENF